MKKVLLILLIIGSSSLLQAQLEKSDLTIKNLQFNAEESFLQSNTDIYLAGETIFYKVFNFVKNSKQISTTSKVAYVELISPTEKTIFKHKHRLENGITHGDFFIPSNLKTNNYKLIAYTNWSKNNTNNAFYQQDIYIINPYIASSTNGSKINEDDSFVEITKKSSINVTKIESNSFQLNTNKNKYSRREKVIISAKGINETLTKGSYSLSVRRIDSIEVIGQLDSVSNYSESELFYLPELRGEIISGKIVPKISASTIPINNIDLSLTIPGKDYIFKSAKTNMQGQFFFNLHENYSGDHANIQILNQDRTNYNIVMDAFEFNHYQHLSFSKLKLNSKIKEWLKKKSIHSQIENAYFSTKTDRSISRKAHKPFYHPIAKVYMLDDFTRFNTIRETFIEIIEDAAVIDANNNPEFKIINYGNTTTTNALTNLAPLVLFDGLLIQDNEDIIAYSAKKIKSISVVAKPYVYGTKVYSGVISFKSKKENFNGLSKPDSFKDIDILNPQDNKAYYQPNYEKNTLLNRIPDYRNQLLWNPTITLNTNSQWEFYTSDNVGRYEVCLEGYTNTGKHILIKEYFDVEN